MVDTADFIGSWPITNFEAAWGALSPGSEVVESFGLSLRSLEGGGRVCLCVCTCVGACVCYSLARLDVGT